MENVAAELAHAWVFLETAYYRQTGIGWFALAESGLRDSDRENRDRKAVSERKKEEGKEGQNEMRRQQTEVNGAGREWKTA